MTEYCLHSNRFRIIRLEGILIVLLPLLFWVAFELTQQEQLMTGQVEASIIDVKAETARISIKTIEESDQSGAAAAAAATISATTEAPTTAPTTSHVPETDGDTLELHRETSKNDDDFACTWKPNDDDPCLRRVSEQIEASLQQLREDNKTMVSLERHRWLFLGDSTMGKLFYTSSLKNHLIHGAPVMTVCPHYRCSKVRAGRCNLAESMKLTRRSQSEWRQPNFTMGEGPFVFGLANPFCLDCSGCYSGWLWCRNGNHVASDDPNNETRCSFSKNTGSSGFYGGYASVEFARDVEIQTDLYTTTQENVMQHIQREWNDNNEPNGPMLSDFGRPICVVSTGHHDIVIPNTTRLAYLTNVIWYLNLFSAQCDHIIWLANNSPLTDDYNQTKNETSARNLAVRDILLHHDSFRNQASFIDIFAASQVDGWHFDNIHMNKTWYELLGSMFLKIIHKSPTAADTAQSRRT